MAQQLSPGFPEFESSIPVHLADHLIESFTDKPNDFNRNSIMYDSNRDMRWTNLDHGMSGNHGSSAAQSQQTVTLNQSGPLPKLQPFLNRMQTPQSYVDPLHSGSVAANCNDLGQNLQSTWMFKHPSLWNNAECLDFFRSVAEDYCLNFDQIDLRSLRHVTGDSLVQMNNMEFLSRDPSHGQLWYTAIRKILNQQTFTPMEPVIPKIEPEYEHHIPFLGTQMNMPMEQNESIEQDLTEYMYDKYSSDEFDDLSLETLSCSNGLGIPPALPVGQFSQFLVNNNYSASSCGSDGRTEELSDIDSCRSSSNSGYTTESSAAVSYGSPLDWSSSSESTIRRNPKLSKGEKKTSRSKHGTRGNHLWEFIRDLLKDKKYNPRIVKWENKEEGVFRFVESETVAKMWGSKKCNPRMTYEKLSRAMRYYYKSQILLPVIGRRLVYKFGPKATNWR